MNSVHEIMEITSVFLKVSQLMFLQFIVHYFAGGRALSRAVLSQKQRIHIHTYDEHIVRHHKALDT